MPDRSPRGLRRRPGARAARRPVAVLGGHARGRRGDDLRHRPRRRALRRLRHQPPGPGRRSRAPRRAAPGRHPLPRRHREDQRVLARLQRRRHPARSGCRTSRASTSASRPRPRPARVRARLIYTNSPTRTPMFTVLLRKASGAGYYAMAGLPYDPIVQLSTSLSRAVASWRAARSRSPPTTPSSTTTSRSWRPIRPSAPRSRPG